MKVLGIVAEYNPFHNGHLYHLEESKRLCCADAAVCVMSGNFVQRGEPAIVSKWARAEMALLAGIDLVLELPVVYSMSSAEYFAYAAVKILDSLGSVDYLCFGSEAGELGILDEIAVLLLKEPDAYKKVLKDMLDKGCSYPSARESAVREHMRDASYHGEALEKAISSSNNILGIEYLKALKRLGSRITPFTLQRVANEYNTEQLTGRISSATAIRRHISSGPGSHSEAVPARALPESTAGVLLREFEAGRGPVYPKSFERMVFSALRRMSPGDIMKLPYISEGLENRIKAAAENEGTLDGLIEAIVTKRYPGTRIRRSLFHLLTGLTAEEFGRFNTFGGPQYIRVLGFNQKGRKLLAKARKNSHLPVFVKAADIKTSCNPLVRRMIEIEAFSTDMYVLGYPGPGFRKGGQEFREGVRQLSN